MTKETEEIREELEELRNLVQELDDWRPLYIPEYPGVDEMKVWEKYEKFHRLFTKELGVLQQRMNNLEEQLKNTDKIRKHYTDFLLDKVARLEYAVGYRDNYNGDLNLQK